MGPVDLYTGNMMLAVGQDEFLHSFFSTIAYQVEREPTPWPIPPGATTLAHIPASSLASHSPMSAEWDARDQWAGARA